MEKFDAAQLTTIRGREEAKNRKRQRKGRNFAIASATFARENARFRALRLEAIRFVRNSREAFREMRRKTPFSFASLLDRKEMVFKTKNMVEFGIGDF